MAAVKGETMGYTVNAIALEEARQRAASYPYMLVHGMSEVLFEPTSAEKIDWDELDDARFFSETEEMHIFRCEKEIRAVIVSDSDAEGEEQTEKLILSRPIAKRFRATGKELKVCQYLEPDEDGQLYVGLTRLCGVQ